MNPEEAVIYLAGCAVNGAIPDADSIGQTDLQAVHDLAAKHMLSACVSMALESAGLKDERTARSVAFALRRTAVFDAAEKELCHRLEEAGIWYMLLKGANLKAEYPLPAMREMSDRDILYDVERSLDVRAIMEDLGFTTESFGTTIHDVYHKAPWLCFEMHSALFGSYHDPRLYTYYRGIQDRLLRDSGTARRLSPEDFYLYITAHEFKHYCGDGTGLRSLLDTYLYLKNHPALDMDYIRTEAEKLGIAAFEEENRLLAQRLFSGKPLSEQEQRMLTYVMQSGVYGSAQHHLENEVRKLGSGKKGKVRYILSRLFLPMDTLRYAHPFIYKSKILIPFFAVYRIIRSLFVERKTIESEINGLKSISQADSRPGFDRPTADD